MKSLVWGASPDIVKILKHSVVNEKSAPRWSDAFLGVISTCLCYRGHLSKQYIQGAPRLQAVHVSPKPQTGLGIYTVPTLWMLFLTTKVMGTKKSPSGTSASLLGTCLFLFPPSIIFIVVKYT